MQKGRSEWLLIAPGCPEKVAKQEVGFSPSPRQAASCEV